MRGQPYPGERPSTLAWDSNPSSSAQFEKYVRLGLDDLQRVQGFYVSAGDSLTLDVVVYLAIVQQKVFLRGEGHEQLNATTVEPQTGVVLDLLTVLVV